MKEEKKPKIGKKMHKEDYERFTIYLDNHKQYVGLSDWKIRLNLEIKQDSDIAEVEPNILEKTLTFSLFEKFFEKNDEEKANILFHELVHGRLSVKDKQVEELEDSIEDVYDEHFVNDIVRGFEQYGEFKLPKKKK